MNKRDCNKMVNHLNELTALRGEQISTAYAVKVKNQGWTIRIVNHINGIISERWGELTHKRYRDIRMDMFDKNY